MNFLSKGFVDTFRKQHPGVVGYTYWGYRHGGRKTNKGILQSFFLDFICKFVPQLLDKPYRPTLNCFEFTEGRVWE